MLCRSITRVLGAAVEYLSHDRSGGRRDRLGCTSVDAFGIVDCWCIGLGGVVGIQSPLCVIECSCLGRDIEVGGNSPARVVPA